MAGMTIDKMRIVPYSQKDAHKIVYGNTDTLVFAVAGHQEGDTYLLGVDYETLLYPPLRPLCAASDGAYADGAVTFAVDYNTARLRDWCSTLRKPTPLHIQAVRVRGDAAETLVLDTLLCLPSVVDGVPTVYPGDPLQDLLAAKAGTIIVNGTPFEAVDGVVTINVPLGGITSITVDGHDAVISGGTATVTTDAVEALDAMPAASAANAGRVALYSGTATADYATGHQYRCDEFTATPTYRVSVNELAETTWGFDGVYEATGTPDEYVSHTGGIGKDQDIWLKKENNLWGLYDVNEYRQYWLLDGDGPAGTYDSADPIQPELWGTATVTEETPGGEVYSWTDITPVQDDAVTSVVVNGSTASVQGGTASVTVPAITSIIANGSTAAVSGGTATVSVPLRSGTVTDGNIAVWNNASGKTIIKPGVISTADSNVGSGYCTLFLGLFNTVNYYGTALFVGNYNNLADQGACIVVGNYNERQANSGMRFCVANGTSNSARSNSVEIYGTGLAYFAGGIEQGVVTIPAATSAYTLSEGCFEHTPATAPTYTLPTVTADNRTHEIVLTVKFTDVQTLAFQDTNGNTLTPQSTPTIAATSVITYLCRWSALAGAWKIYPVVEVE